MAKHEKFTLDELPESAVVNKNKGEDDNGIEDFINNAVQEHIKKIAQPPKPFEIKSFEESSQKEDVSVQDNPDDDPDSGDEDSNQDSINQGENKKSDDESKKSVDDSLESRNIDAQVSKKMQSPEEGGVSEDSKAGQTDVEEADRQEYQRGFADAKAEVAEQSMLQEKVNVSNAELTDKLLEGLSGIVPEADFNEKVAKLSAEAISGIAKKLHLVLPVDFEEIICRGLIDKLNKFYKEGSITIKIHPERYEFCSQILQLDSIPAKFKGNFKIEQDDKLTVDDCLVEWEDTVLEYSREQLSEEIDIIIERLTNAA